MLLTRKLGISVQLGKETEFKPVSIVRYLPVKGRTIIRKPILVLELTVSQLMATKLPKDFVADRLYHELGHFIAANKVRRKRVDYGIKNNSKFAAIEELKANFVERELRQHFGKHYTFTEQNKKMPEYKKAEEWWLSEGQNIVQTLLDFL